MPNDEVRRLAAAFPVPPGRIEVAGAGHSNVVGTGGEELVRRIAEFLDGVNKATNPLLTAAR